MKSTSQSILRILFFYLAGATSLPAAQGVAIAIGLNAVDPAHYGGWSGPLNACENDALDMERIASSQGFVAHTLLTTSATRGAVISALTQAAGTLVSGDTLVVSYSGHGGQLPDSNGDEADAMDEPWCLYDGQLIDDELAALWSKFKEGVRICVYSDSCHSGTVTKYMQYTAALKGAASDSLFGLGFQERFSTLSNSRSEGAQPPEAAIYRAMPELVAQTTYTANRAFYDDLSKTLQSEKDSLSAVVATVILISGCQDNQLSADGTFNGLFTAKLKQVWSNGGFHGGHPEFRDAILSLMPSVQSPNYYVVGKANAAFDSQRPWTK